MVAYTKQTGKGDVGYSYLRYDREGKKPPFVVATASNKSVVRCVFVGECSATPKAGSLKVCLNWGIDFHLMPRRDFDHGSCLPAWFVQVATAKTTKATDKDGNTVETTESDANISMASEEVQFEFAYQRAFMKPEKCRTITLTFYTLNAEPKSFCKGTILKRPAFPQGVEINKAPEVEPLAHLRQKAVVRSTKSFSV